MSEHHSTITWKRRTETFSYEEYNRDHEWEVKDGLKIPASAALSFFGNAAHCDPEEALISALASCHMLTFLALASKKRYIVDAYVDKAVGILDKNEESKLAITSVTLNPRVVFSGERQPTQEELASMHEKAHEHCFIANSLKTNVEINL